MHKLLLETLGDLSVATEKKVPATGFGSAG